MSIKLNTLLGKTEQLKPSFTKGLSDYYKFFKDKQGAFKGEKKTYTAKDGTLDEPTKRGINKVQTTVTEKLQYFMDDSKEYINAVLDQEATNANGGVKARLVVDGTDFGTLSALELMRLKTIITMQEFVTMNEHLPVRSDTEMWNATKEPTYEGREVFENLISTSTNRTTIKTPYILEDPNLDKLKDFSGYKPQQATRDTLIELGEGTHQLFSGEWTQEQKAKVLQRLKHLRVAIGVALKECNDAEVVSSEANADKLFGYIYGLTPKIS